MSSNAGRDFSTESLDPIDLVETLATERQWDFDRLDTHQIAMVIEGSWRTYSLTIASSPSDATLRIVCAYELRCGKRRRNALNEVMHLANDRCWTGAFIHWESQRLLGYRYALLLAREGQVTSDQIDSMVSRSVLNCERYYPVFQAVVAGEDPNSAMSLAINEAYGRA